MVIIIDNGQTWVEMHSITHPSIASGERGNSTLTLDKPGLLMGWTSQCAVNSDFSWVSMLAQTDNNQLDANDIGGFVTALNSIAFNPSPSTQTVISHHLLFMKKRE